MSTIRLNISPFCHITYRMVLSELYLHTASRRKLPTIHKKAERKCCPFCFACHSFLPFLMCIADNTKYPFFRITSRTFCHMKRYTAAWYYQNFICTQPSAANYRRYTKKQNEKAVRSALPVILFCRFSYHFPHFLSGEAIHSRIEIFFLMAAPLAHRLKMR